MGLFDLDLIEREVDLAGLPRLDPIRSPEVVVGVPKAFPLVFAGFDTKVMELRWQSQRRMI
jgi:hypothetical protein